MAYSRWGDSIWYTFWVGANLKYKFPTGKLKNEQLFEICDFPSYYVNYGSIKNNGIDEVIKEIKDFYSQEHKGQIFNGFVDGKLTYKETTFEPKNITSKELEELKGYLGMFIKDVDDYFELKNFFYYEWYLELLEGIKKLFNKKKKKSQ